jgi:pyruvate carboxylase
VRAMRAAAGLDMENVAACPLEDRHSSRRSKASESCQTRGGARPAQACLDVQQVGAFDRAPPGPVRCRRRYRRRRA